jgi:hypothetical protein
MTGIEGGRSGHGKQRGKNLLIGEVACGAEQDERV